MKPFGHVPVIMEKKMVRNSEKMQVMVRENGTWCTLTENSVVEEETVYIER